MDERQWIGVSSPGLSAIFERIKVATRSSSNSAATAWTKRSRSGTFEELIGEPVGASDNGCATNRRARSDCQLTRPNCYF